MKEPTSKTEESLSFPSQINIQGYLYTKKDVYKNCVCYRCSNRSVCQLTITIEFNEIIIIKNKNNNELVNYKINSRQKEHSCVKIINKEVEVKKCLTIDEVKLLERN